MKPTPESRDDADRKMSLVFQQLRDANEQLILSAVRAQMESELAAQRLAEVRRSAELDALTGLPNRMLLQDRFAQAMAIAKRRGTRLAILFLDLNEFKQVNDTLGHVVGDEVLRQAGSALVAAVRAADTVSRHGGDEFVVLLTDVGDRRVVTTIVEKLLATLATPIRQGAHVVRLTASIGISLFPDDGDALEVLLGRADAAMYRSKRRGVAHYSFHGDAVGGGGEEPPRIVVPPRSVTYALDAEHEHERQNATMRDANEQLVLAALAARATQSDLEEANRRQAEFMAMLAHELRNPLAPMRNVSALLARVKPDDPIMPRLQDIIERQVVHMARLIDDLLDVSRAHSGKLHLEFHEVELTAIVTEAIALCQPAMDLRLQHFAATIPAPPVHVTGDAMRLTQVLTNLLDNASKYTPDGGTLTLAMTETSTEVVIAISDDGIGISAEALPAVFDLFAQDVHAVGFNGIGLGIGLTVVHELVVAHGGTVVATSQGPGRGSQFVVTLPVRSAALSDEAPTPA